MLVDPVCCQQVTPSKTPFVITYKERTFYFCSAVCMRKFEFEPDRYASDESRTKVFQVA